MEKYNKKVGEYGEKIAEKYLLSKGYKILYKNFTTPHGEIDIIAKIKGLYVFFEVKTRTTDSFGFPEEAVSEAKQEHLLDSIEYFLEQNKLEDLDTRADIISIQIDKENKKAKIWQIKGFL